MSNASSNVPDSVPSPESGPGATGEGEATDGAVTGAVETTHASGAEPKLSVDVIFEILKNERRRRVIEYLRANEGTAELGETAEHIAALENDKEVKAISYAERKRVYVGLYQCHLPKMDDMGVVEFNRARGRIELTDEAIDLLPYLDGPVTRRPWHRYYGAVVLGGLLLYGGTILTAGTGVFSTELVLGVVLVALTVCTVGQFRERTSNSSV